MASPEKNDDRFQWRVRPGLQLFLFSALAVAICDKAGLAKYLGVGPSVVKYVILVVTVAVTALGWFLLCKDSGTLHARYKWITLIGAVVLTLSIAAFSLFDVVPIKVIVRFDLVSALDTILWRWQGCLLGLAWVIPFFGRGRSRVAFVIGSTLMLFLWAATSGSLSSPVYGWF